MLHQNRRFVVADVDNGPKLACCLKDMAWCLCNGFRYQGILWLNDSISEDSAQEYAVVREADMVQLESITVSWSTREALLEYIRSATNGTMEPMFGQISNIIEAPADHGRCHLCR